LQLAFVSLIHSANDRPNEKPRRCERSRALGDDGECPDVRAVKARAGTIRTGVNIEHESGGMRSDTAMDRNADRQSRIAEDLARLLALRNAIYDCKSAVNQSLAVIDSTLDAIALLYRLQHPRPPDAGPEPHGSAPAPRASQTTASE
jgi:hypothetical protein